MALSLQRWLILVHQLPPHPSNLRVRVWRRLQQVGAAVLRNSLYVLPATDEAREDFNWVREEIVASGGQVSVLEAEAVDGYTDSELKQQFRRLRTSEYEALAAEVRTAGSQASKRRRQVTPADRERTLRTLRERLAAIQGRDYFGAAGRLIVEQAIKDLEHAQDGHVPVPASTKSRASDFRRRTWVTRPRPGIDRFACAWFVRRFIAPNAKFVFADSAATLGSGQVAFDMPDVEFGHHGSHCSLETLIQRFGISDPAVLAVSRVVHDLDLKEARYGMPEGAAVARIVDGLRASFSDDAKLLEHGIVMIDALYRSFATERGAAKKSKKRREKAS